MFKRSTHLLFLVFVLAPIAPAYADDPRGVEFFEKKIRPVLVEHCYRCHSAEAPKLRGKLRLDTAEGMRKGGEIGLAVVPGKVQDSLIMKALRYEGGLEMPPNGKLPPNVVNDFEKWVAMGAPDPRAATLTAKVKTLDFEAARKHWAFQPVRQPSLPRVANAAWTQSPLDFFILNKLEEKGLTPAPRADRRTLIRRAYLDLIGLPPTFEEVQAFVNDPRPDAFAHVVDHLLASPHYGERWGRHWLDVARYADTKDLVLVYGKDAIRPYAYTYRDYVVKAFNEDVPYDQFIREQLAADQIEPKVAPWKLGAMGYLTLGRLFDNNLPDIYDDQIDTVSRGLLGLTVSCARCHDHKYDAIPTADYYSLYSVFASSEVPVDLPLIAAPAGTPGAREFAKKVDQKREQLRQHVEGQFREITELLRQQTTDYLLKVTGPPDPLETSVFFLSLSPNDLRPGVTVRWRRFVAQRALPKDPVFGPWHDLLELSPEQFSESAGKVLERWQSVPGGVSAGQVNPLVRQALLSAKLMGKADVARAYGELLKKVYMEAKQGSVEKQSEPSARKQLLEILTGPDSPTHFLKSKTFLYMSRTPRDNFGQLVHQIDRLAVDAPDAPPRAMVLADAPELATPRIFVRGNPRQLGDMVPRQFLQLLSPGGPKLFTHGSGRLDLANAIADRNNPLTARVLVNRVWLYHFGQPLVQTPDDFGVRSSPPSHPELLDHLAWYFVKEGWSLKKLHRSIMLSSVYQQTSLETAANPDAKTTTVPQTVDPENRLLWHFPRQPLDLEAMRDTLLCLSGRLDRKVGGLPVDIAADPNNCRRTIYGVVDRQNLPNLFRAFNFANPDQTTGQRPQTTVPQQALFAMNAPFVLQQARALAARPEVVKEAAPEKRIAVLYRIVLQRDPTVREVELGQRFVQAAAQEQNTAQRSQLSPWEQYAQVLLATSELMFAD